ncbi:MAG: DNA recombination protein RmuC [Flavobacteriales bacterium]|nr:DNA recombination protein RmuC [Flavobacteriales bacterium]
MEIILLILGISIGFTLGFFYQRSKSNTTPTNGNQDEIDLLKNQLHEIDKQRALAEERIANAVDKFKYQEEDLDAKASNIDRLKEENILLQANNNFLDEKLQTQKQELENIQKKFSTEFENIANRILKQNTTEFSETNRKKLNEVLNPLKEKLGEFEEKVQKTYEKGLAERSTLAQQIKNLAELNKQMHTDAQNLTKALKGDSKTQGNWGELQLEKILERAGLERGIHYEKEHNLKTEEGANQRLDYIIKLPDDKHLIIDSKVSLTAYNYYYNEEDEVLKEQFFKEHLGSVTEHINSLSNKNYQNLDITQPDYVMMFLANEPALTLALKKEPRLFEKALEKNIVLVSSSTLLATLRTISYIWKTDKQNKNAKEIADQAGKLYDKFVGFTGDLLEVGKKMEGATKSYESAMKKLSMGSGNLVGHVQKLKKLGASTTSNKNIEQTLLDQSEDDEI